MIFGIPFWRFLGSLWALEVKDPQPVGTEEIPNFEISILNLINSRKYGAVTYLL